MPKWFATIDRKLIGPLAAAELIRRPGFGPETEVTADDGEEFWLPAGKVPDFFPLLREAPASPVPPESRVCPNCGGEVRVSAEATRTTCPYCDSSLTKGKGGVLCSAPCPSCGDSVEYPEHSRTAHCPRCDISLLIHAPGRAFRLYAPPRFTPKSSGARLVFVPYWRYTASLFGWNIGKKTTGVEPFGISKTEASNPEAGAAVSAGFFEKTDLVREFRATRFDRSLRAAAEPAGSTGLDARVSRLRLIPYDRDAMQSSGRIAEINVPEERAAEWIARKGLSGLRNSALFDQSGFSRALTEAVSLVYFPVWEVPEGRSRTVFLDGIDGAPVPPAELDPGLCAGGSVAVESEVPRCLAAECPRCANELPVEPFQALFYCAVCDKVWRPEGKNLVEQPFTVAAGRTEPGEGTLRLPLWRMRVEIDYGGEAVSDQKAFRKLVSDISYAHPAADPDKPVYIFAPAWGNMIYMRLSRIASIFTRKQTVLEKGPSGPGGLIRAVYGPDDARAMAKVILAGIVHLRGAVLRDLREAKVRVLETDLFLLPATEKSRSEFVEHREGVALNAVELREKK